jgi:hypothetical protein
VDFESFLDQEPLAVVIVALEVDLESLAEDAQGVVIKVWRVRLTTGVIMRFGSWFKSACLRIDLPVPGSPRTRHKPPCWAWTLRMSKTSCW